MAASCGLRAASSHSQLPRTLGVAYHGPIDGHDVAALTAAFEQLKQLKGPQLLHVLTVKGKGFDPAEVDPIKYHGVSQFDPVTG